MDGTKLFREEARRLKASAVEKYKAGDLFKAKVFAVRAQRYNPALCGHLCLNAVLDVRMGFARKINGEVDWYAVLSVDTTADLETIKERYRKLSLDIIMDDDNSIGSSEEVCQILDDSWKALCNEKRKQLYDKSREVQLLHGRTFWTVCHYCGFQYEYQNFYKDQLAVCSHCYKNFRATECPAPSMAHAIPWTFEMKTQLRRKRYMQFSSWLDASTAPKVEVKKNMFHVIELRRISTDTRIRHCKLMLPPNMLRSASLGKSKSMITLEEMRGEEKRRRV